MSNRKNWLPARPKATRRVPLQKKAPRLNILSLEAREVPATLVTDQLDYTPNSTATILGSGFQPGETVELVVHRADEVSEVGEPGHEPWRVTDGGTGDLDGLADGNVKTTACIYEQYLGGKFQVEATGLSSGQMATTQFTDARSTTTSLTASIPNSSVYGQQVTFTATVIATNNGGNPVYASGGTVTFKDGGNTLGSATLTSTGVATFPTQNLSIGTHTITAEYSGVGNQDSNGAYAPSSHTLSYAVKAATTTAVTTSASASVVGQSVTFTATVGVVSPGTGTPAGTVTFKDGTTTLGTGSLNASGVANISTSTLAAGSHTITAEYSGNDAFGTSAGSLSQTVSADSTAPTTTPSLSPAPNAAGWNNATVTLTLAAVDNTNGTGVAATYYRVGGTGNFVTYDANNKPTFTTEGSYAVEFYSKDNAGNIETTKTVTVKLDKTGPTVSGATTTPANTDGWYNGPVTVRFAATDSGSGVASVDADKTLSTEGASQSVSGSATDNAGNTGSGSATGINIDLTEPAATISGGPGSLTNSKSASFTIIGADALSGVKYVEYKLDAGEWTQGSGTINVGSLADGSHTLYVRSVDKAGNVSDLAQSAWTVDTVAPNAPVVSSPSAAVSVNASSYTIGGSAEAGSLVQVWKGSQLVGSQQLSGQGTAYSISVDLAQDAVNSFTVTATDAAGNVSPAATAFTITEDSTAPSLPVVSTPAGTVVVNADSYVISGTAEANSTVKVYRGSVAPANLVASGIATGGSYSLTAILTQNAFNPFVVTSTDAAGNESPAATVPAITEDSVAPDAPAKPALASGSDSGSSTTDNITNVTKPTLTGSAEAGSTVTVYDGGTVIGTTTAGPTGVWSLTLADALTDGTHSLAVKAADAAGNTSAASAALSVTIDTAKPTVTATAATDPNSHGWYKGNVTVRFTSSDDRSGVLANPADQVLSSEGQAVSSTAVNVTDLAGNVSDASNVVTVKVDKTAPTISGAATTAPNADGWYKADVVIAWTVSDALSGIDTPPGDSTITGQGDALSTSASVSDLAGNTNSATVSGIKVDRVAPTTTHSIAGTLGNNGWYTSSATVTLTPSDALSGVKATEYSLDGGQTWVAGTSIDLTADGTHSVLYRSVDKAGNAESANSVTLNVDKTAPTITADVVAGLKAYTAAHGGWNNTAVTAGYNASDLGSGLASDATGTHVLLTPGANQSYTFMVYDKAGNSSSATVTGVNIDVLGPKVSLSRSGVDYANAHDGWTNFDVTVSYTATDTYAETTGNSGLASGATGSKMVSAEGAAQTAAFTLYDVAGNAANVDYAGVYSGIKIDKTAPATTDDAPSAWQKGAVTVRLKASDQVGLSGVNRTEYSTDGGQTWVAYAGGITLAAQGTHTVAYRSVDVAGNVEDRRSFTVNIDVTAPQTNASTNKQQYATDHSGWNNTDVQVTLSAGDTGGSGLSQTEYSLDNGATWTPYGAPFTLSQEGTHTVLYRSTDVAGNVETAKAQSVNIDKAAPTIAIDKASGVYASGTSFNWTTGDALSGWNTTVVTVDGVVMSAEKAASYVLNAGIHSVEVSTTDKAGNVKTETRRYSVTGAGYDENGNVVVVGTDANDTIAITSTNSGAVAVRLNDGAAQSFNINPTTGRVIAYGLGGNDTLTMDGPMILEAHGGTGNDTVTGGAGNDVIWGDGGADQLTGGAGHDVLIGGDGMDRLVGSSGNDILIAVNLKDSFFADARTKYNLSSTAGTYDVMNAIRGDWLDTVGTSEPDTGYVDSTDVYDESSDVMTGGSGRDWFWVTPSDSITDAGKVKNFSASQWINNNEDRVTVM